MNAAERVRAYLQARATIYDGDQPGTCTTARNKDTGQVHRLMPADLEALLQTIEILAQLASRNLVQEEDPTRERYAEQQVPDPASRPALAQCTRCGRFTWAPSEVNTTDQMTQPSGQPCGGYMEALK